MRKKASVVIRRFTEQICGGKLNKKDYRLRKKMFLEIPRNLRNNAILKIQEMMKEKIK